MFELVACPHYLAEIVIYFGLLATTGGELLPLLMLIWVVSALWRDRAELDCHRFCCLVCCGSVISSRSGVGCV